ncbi:neprilysin-2-like [Thrips palmi]|uniref:Neprilysin-2-like n=1 Tax=Thrips palmi TaxID=161013 RepID=A0A6P9A2A4_THRPL|nr:neprilysin-2-like [Thrips palmi]
MVASMSWPRTACVGLLALLCVSLSPSSARPSSESAEATTVSSVQDEECLTEGCNRTVASLARAMNLSINPCDDFYQFACGRYVRDTPLPPNKGTVSVVSQLEDVLREQLRELLAEAPGPGEPAAFGKAKTLYQSCMNTTRLEELGVEPAKKILATLGVPSWPILESDAWDDSEFDWQNMSFKLMEMGLYDDFIFAYGVEIDINNTARHALKVEPPEFNLDLVGLDNVTRTMHVQEYLYELLETAKMLRPEVADLVNTNKLSLLQEETEKVATLEITLNLCTMSLEDRRNLTLGLTEMPLSRLQEIYPYVSWLNYTKHMLPPGANVTEDESVVVVDVVFMAALGKIMEATPKRVLANYLVWRVLENTVMDVLNEKARSIGVKRKMARWEECVKAVQIGMRMATSAMYVRRHSSEEARNKTVEMVQDISKEMHRLLDSVDWMDPKTRRAAMMKAEVMRYNVAYPQELLNDTLLDQFYEKLEVQPNDLLGNTLAVEKRRFDRSMAKYRTKVQKYHWSFISGIADIVNAFFLHSDNSLSIPAGLMQGAFFQKDRPQYMNYGGIGFAIGHEVSHAFDETGGLFDMNGLLANWWDVETKKLFDEKVRCIVDQYSSMKDPNINVTVNGILTQSENIADNAALKLAYRAYMRYTARHGTEPRTTVKVLDDDKPRTVTLKPRQMFWVSFASAWCSKETHKDLNLQLRTNSHLPGVHRVNGAVSNTEEFASDFKCPVGSPMNPVHKCQVW